jgi:hypothetical protein
VGLSGVGSSAGWTPAVELAHARSSRSRNPQLDDPRALVEHRAALEI